MYRLVISGNISFDEDGRDESIRQLLFGEHCLKKFEVALKEISENATNTEVSLIKLC